MGRGRLYDQIGATPPLSLCDLEFCKESVRQGLLDGPQFEELLGHTEVGIQTKHGALVGMELLSRMAPGANEVVAMRAVEMAPHSLRFAARQNEALDVTGGTLRPDALGKISILLENQYTEENLKVNRLKGVDAQ